MTHEKDSRDSSLEQSEAKQFAGMQACLALRGHALMRTESGTHGARFIVMRWGYIRPFADLAEVERFLRDIEAGHA